MTVGSPAASPSMSRPKNGSPVRPIWSRGSRESVLAIITYARPVSGPALTVSGTTTSNRVSDGSCDAAGRAIAVDETARTPTTTSRT